MVRVEVLGTGGWNAAGSYRPERAAQLAELLRLGGAIVRVEGERPIRGRLTWVYEDGSGSWVGQVDGIDLFALTPQPGRAGLASDIWTLHVLLPGYHREKVFRTQELAEDAAEQIVDNFVWRIGVRAMSDRSPTTDETIEMPTVE